MNNLFPDIEDQEQEQKQNLPMTFPGDPNAYEEEIPPQPGDSEDDYDFKTGSLDDFMHSFQEGKEEMPIDELPTPEEFTEAGKPNLPPATARKSAKFCALMVDYSCATGLSLLSGEPIAAHKAEDDARKELESIIAEYIKETGGEVPISVQLIICILVTYGLQVPGAYKKYKERKALEDHVTAG